MYYFVWVAWGDLTNWGISAPSPTWADCVQWAHLYAAEGVTTSLCFLQ